MLKSLYYYDAINKFEIKSIRCADHKTGKILNIDYIYYMSLRFTGIHMHRTLQFVAFITSLLFTIASSYGNPTGHSVAGGSFSFNQTVNTLTIKQTTSRGIINWKKFNIGQNQTTDFIQPPGGIALNRVTTGNPAMIFGKLTATGQIILVDSGGIFFGPHSYVNVGGIIASTTDISNNNFLNSANSKILNFDIPASSNAAIINKGTIIARDHGLVALIGSAVSNEGVISAKLGSVVLASGNKFTVDMNGNGLVNFVVGDGVSTTPATLDGQQLKYVNNSGKIMADGGTILLSAKTAQHVLDNVINMSGIAQARSVDEHNGEIIFSGGPSGTASVSGKVDASGQNPNTSGGTVKILGDHVHVASTANIDASGPSAGGTIFIGGDAQGLGPDQNASTTTVDAGALLNANATSNGNGGHIVLWSNDNTQFHGNTTAEGGPLGGNGGFIETSGGYLNIDGSKVSTFAPKGQTGTWLLDPVDVNIDSSSDVNAQLVNNIYQPIDGNTSPSTIDVSLLIAALANNNILVTTSAFNGVTTGSGVGDINVNAAIAWSANTTLTLSAYRNINVNQNISNSGSGNLVLQTDNTGTGTGTVIFSGGTVSLTGGTTSIYYDTASYTNFNSDFSTFAGNVTGNLTTYMLVNTLGNSNDPDTSTTLGAISNNSDLWGYNYALGKDIDASNTSSAGWNGGAGFVPIGNASTAFSGQLDGQGYYISNVTINLPNTTPPGDYGFIGLLSNTGVIQNLGLLNENFSFSSSVSAQIGGLVGLSLGTINNSYTTGTLFSSGFGVRTGGLAGVIDNGMGAGTITNSYSMMNITDVGMGNYQTLGGLVGSDFGNITHSYAGGNISITGFSDVDLVGGFAGEAQNSTINDSYSYGTVSSEVSANRSVVIGGFIGFNTGTINNSYSTSSLINTATTTPLNMDVGGFVGQQIGGIINNSYSTGFVNTAGASGSPLAVGGFIGDNQGSVNNGYWDNQTSNLLSSDGGTPETTAQLQTSLASLGFPTSDWGMIAGDGVNPNGSYPYLLDLNSDVPRVISGFAPGGSPSATGLTDTTIQLADAGNDVVTHAQIQGSVLTGNNGFYYFLEPNGAITDNSSVLTYIPSGSANTVTIAPSSGGSITGLNMAANTLSVGDNNMHTISNSILASAIGGSLSSGVLYSAIGNNLTLNTGTNFSVNNQITTYQLNGNIAITDSASGGNFTFGTGTLTVASSEILSGPGNFTFNGNTSGAGTLTLQGTASSPSNTFTFGGTLYSTIDVIGNATSNNSLLFQTLAPTWDVNSANAGIITSANITSFNYSNIESLTGSGTYNITSSITSITGGSGTNLFNIDTGGSVTTLTGVGSNNTLSYSSYTGAVSVDLGTDLATQVGTFSNIQSFSGNDVGGSGTSSTLTDTSGSNTWTMSAANGGNITGVASFSNFGILAGGTGDTFNVDSSGSESGSVSATNGTLSYSTYGSAVTVTLGAADSATGITGAISGFTHITGNTATSSTNVVQDTTDGGRTWAISGTDIGNVNASSGTVVFTKFGTLKGGNSDTFNVGSSGSASGTISATNGTLSYSTFGTPANVNLQNRTASNIASISGFSNFVGPAGTLGTSSMLTGSNTLNTWTLDSVNGGNINSGAITFSGFGNVTGGPGANSFTVEPGANINNLNGGGSSNTSNSFFILGGTVASLNGGVGTTNLLSTSTGSAVTLNEDNTSGSISGGATVLSFTNIESFSSSNSGDILNVDTSLTSLTTGPGVTLNIGSSGNITGTLTMGANSSTTISGSVNTINLGTDSTLTLNPGSSITNMINGASGATLVASTGSPLSWTITGTSGTVTGGGINATFQGVPNVNGGNGGDTYNLSGTITTTITGGNGLNTFNLADGTTIANLIGGNASNGNIINTQSYTQALAINLINKVSGGWQGTISEGGTTIVNFTNLGEVIGRSGVSSTITVPGFAIKFIQFDPSTHSGILTDPFIFQNFDATQFSSSPALNTTVNVLSYTNQVTVFPTSVTPEETQFNYIISSMSSIDPTQQQLDVQTRDQTQFGCITP